MPSGVSGRASRKTNAEGTICSGNCPCENRRKSPAVVPAVGLWATFEFTQKLYAIVGALFIPMLAVVLLVLGGQSKLIGNSR